MLGKIALADNDLATATDSASAADGIDIHPQLPGAVEKWRADRKAPPLSRRGETT